MEDILRTRDKIEHKIAELEIARSYIEQYALEKAEAIANYEKEIALTLVKLNAGTISRWKNEEIGKINATNLLTVAKGICYQFQFEKEEKSAQYSGLVTRIDCIKAELNGYQSINRYLE